MLSEDSEKLFNEIKKLEKEVKNEATLKEKKEVRVTFRVNASEKILLDLKAEWFSQPVSDLIRASVFDYRMPDPQELEFRKELNNLNHNQARLGNLLNQWLASQYHMDITTELRAGEHIMRVLRLLDKNQVEIKEQLDLLRLGKHNVQQKKID